MKLNFIFLKTTFLAFIFLFSSKTFPQNGDHNKMKSLFNEATAFYDDDQYEKAKDKNEELFFHLDNKLVDNGLSTFRKDLITHDELIKYAPISNEEVNVFFAIAEISQDDYCVFINSTSVQMFVYDKDEIIYKNAVGILNGYHINLDYFISKREEDIKLAIGTLLDSFNEAYK